MLLKNRFLEIGNLINKGKLLWGTASRSLTEAGILMRLQLLIFYRDKRVRKIASSNNFIEVTK